MKVLSTKYWHANCLLKSVERKHNTNGRGGRSQIIPKLRTGFEEDEENQKKR